MNSANENAKPNDEDFNINDSDESQSRERQANSDEVRSGRKSPALSIVSTASSGSPLIRSGSVDSKAEGAAGQPRRPAPTSIAAAQLKQQQQQQQLQQHGQTKKNQAAKLQSGNKLAHMAKMAAISSQTAQFEQQAADLDQRLKGPAFRAQVQRDKPEKKSEKGGGGGQDENKSFGYKLGKSLAFRANRFNQFWSVNKMRYMNLACLLMTLVCLCTILLFSKSRLVSTRSELAPSQRPVSSASPLVSGADRHKSRIGSIPDQDVGDQETSGDSIELTVRRQIGGKTADKADDQTESESSADSDEQVATTRPSQSDGFNLFDERHDQSQAQDQDQESLIQEARKQLKRQQETELEMEDEGGSSAGVSSSRPTVLVSVQRSRPIPFLQDPINQVLQDLDGFGLFKSIRSRLAEQLKQRNLTSKPATVIRSKNGATIIMSFSQQGDSNGTATNETASSSSSSPFVSPLVESMPGFLRDLLPPSVLEQGKRSPSGFAAIALDSQPRATLSFRSSNLPFGGALFDSSSSSASPFFGPASPFDLPPLFMPPPPPQLLNQQRQQMMPPTGGLMSMLLRASRELANQMRHQMEQAAASSNQTSSGSNDTTSNKQAQASQQQVKVIQLSGGSSEQNTNETSQQANSTEPDVAADEVETFSTARFIGLPSSRSFEAGERPVASRSAAPRSMLMIESSSGVPSSLLAADGDQLQPSPMLAPFPLMPSVFFMGPTGSGQNGPRSSRAHPGPNPLLRSLIGSVFSDLTRSISLEGESASRRPISRSDDLTGSRDQDGEPNEWDEWNGDSSDGPAGGATGSNQDGPLMRSGSASSSLFENVFEHLISGRHQQRPQVGSSGATFKHTLRTPSGITIERIAGLPAGVQTVAPNVRSQSISRLIESPAVESEMGNRLARSRAGLSQDDESDSGADWRQLADEHQGDGSTRRAMRARHLTIDRMDSPQPDFDQQDPFPARIRVASARIRLLSPPRLDSTGLPPLHFRLPAQPEQASDEPSDGATSKRPAPNSSSAVFTSPNSPLFGFPALRSDSSASSGSEQEAGEHSQQAGGQRRPRTFVYHSNHELARPSQTGARPAPQVAPSQHKQPPVDSWPRSATGQQQRQHAAPLPPAAAVVMGRRLDDLVER